MKSETESTREVEGAPPLHPISTRELLGVVRGFSCLMWSIPLGLFLSTGAIDLAISRYFRLPTYIVAVMLFLWGLIILRRAPQISRRWKRYLHQAFILALLLIYFTPFILWWSQHPRNNHFMINVFGLLLTTTWLLWIINRLSGEVGAALRDRILLIESRLCGWAVGAFMMAPLIVYMIYALVEAGRRNVAVYWILLDLRRIPYATVIMALVMLPLTLTMAVAWKTKERALRALRAKAEER